jgi:hypothetical protein
MKATIKDCPGVVKIRFLWFSKVGSGAMWVMESKL